MRSFLLAALRRIGVPLRAEELGVVWMLFGYSFLVGIFQFTSKAVRQATYVDTLGAERLPWVYLLVAVVAYPTMRLYNVLADRVSRGTLIAGTTWIMAGLLVVFWQWMTVGGIVVAIAYYLFIAIATVLAFSQLWSHVGALLDLRQARRLFGFIGAGALLGGVVGGQVARIAGAGGTHLALLLSAGILLTIGGLALVLERRSRQSLTITGRSVRADLEREWAERRLTARPEGPRGFRLLLETPHLAVVALVLALSVIAQQVVDLQFSWVVEQRTSSLSERSAAFGNVYSVMGLCAFLFQLLLTARIHRTLGVGFAMRVMPYFLLAASVLVLGAEVAVPAAVAGVLSVLKVGETGLRYSLDHVTRELLMVPVPADRRPLAKSYIDVVVQRFAKGAAGLLLLPVAFGWITALQVTWLTLALCVVWLLCTFSAQRQYVGSLRSGLARRSGGRGLDPGELLDVGDITTLEVLVESLGSADPDRVLQAIELLAGHGRARLVPPLLLHHAEPAVRRRTLEALQAAHRDDALPLVEKCLGDEAGEVRVAAIQALAVLSQTEGPRLMAERIEDPDPRVRAAAIACLVAQGTAEDRRVAERSLQELMADADATSRRSAAQALGELGDPRHDAHLVRLLYDEDATVVRAAIAAVRARASAGSTSPLFPPILISLLRDRRLKHEAREALVSHGAWVVPSLAHFLNDAGEQMWVRRAIPKTLARIGGTAAIDALFVCLGRSTEPMLRRKVVEALLRLDGEVSQTDPRLQRAIVAECERYARALVLLHGLGPERGPELSGPPGEPSLLLQLVDERRLDHQQNVMRLLGLLCDRLGVEEAHHRLLGADAGLRLRAIEYLDNVVAGPVRAPVLMVIDDLPPPERLELADRLFSLRPLGRRASLLQLVRDVEENDEGEAWLAAAAIHEAASAGAGELGPFLPALLRLARDGRHELVTESARWACNLA
ncbi:MAG TPA: Npt1/Npt2 family nucleotide transporter [Thermoanaerobaculia bacterium]|nr:Npt1/Npt2 family nucleotide transporter [Thermoanaerobaculia bacterium]